MRIDIIELLIIILLLIYIAYLQKLHYHERKDLFSRINTSKPTTIATKPSKTSNFIRRKIERAKQGGE